MNSADHFREAERLLAKATGPHFPYGTDSVRRTMLQEAQIHAALASCNQSHARGWVVRLYYLPTGEWFRDVPFRSKRRASRFLGKMDESPMWLQEVVPSGAPLRKFGAAA